MARAGRVLGLLLVLGALALPLVVVHFQLDKKGGENEKEHVPAFIEPGEHGFDPFFSSYCHKAGHTSFATSNVNLISGDGLVQTGSNKDCFTPQNEPALAQDPTDPNHLVAGSNDYRLCCDSIGRNDSTGWAYVSHDGGKSWRNVLLPGMTKETNGRGIFGQMDSAGDPSIAFAPNGKDVYYANIVFSRTNQAISGIAVSVSHDGGNDWGLPKMVYLTNNLAVFNDKEWVTVGADGRVAITWTLFELSGLGYVSPIVGSISKDGGKRWGKAFLVSDLKHYVNQGSQPFFDSNGNLIVVHEGVRNGSFDDAILVSTVAPGKKLPVTREVAKIFDQDGCFVKNQDGRATLSGEQFRITTFPAAAIDTTTNTLAIAYVDGERGCGKPQTNVQVKLLYVNGWHHSVPQIVTGGGDKAFPSIAVHNGITTIGFFTRTFSKTVALDYAYASSADGFVEHRVSDGDSNPYMQFRGAFMGDYSSMAVGSDGVAHFVWTDSRGGDQNILTAAAPVG